MSLRKKWRQSSNDATPIKRCAIYTRKSREEGLEQTFNSLDAQRDYAEKYIASQEPQGWQLIPTQYDDGGFSGGTLERPALKRLLRDIADRQVDCVVVYKIDRLSRSLSDCFHLINELNHYQVDFVSVTESFHTHTATGRLMLGSLLNFSQYERELTGERIRDKIAASKQKGFWMGGYLPLGYDCQDRQLCINPQEAAVVRHIFQRFTELSSITTLVRELHHANVCNKRSVSRQGNVRGGHPFNRNSLRRLLTNPLYHGQIVHQGQCYPGQHRAIIDETLWSRVQECFAQHAVNAPEQRQTHQATGALLKGLLRCQACDAAMSPTYTRKKNRQYHYYLCNNHFRHQSCSATTRRLPAAEVESFVVAQVRDLLHSPEIKAQASQLLETNANLTPEKSVALLQDMEAVWQQLFPQEQHRILHLLIRVIYVSDHGIDVRIRQSDLQQLCCELETAKPTASVSTYATSNYSFNPCEA